MVVHAKPNMVLPDFLPFLMMSDRFIKRAVEILVGSLSPTINWATLEHEKFDLPPLDQQSQIAEMLWAVDKVIQTSILQRYTTEAAYSSAINELLFSKRQYY